MKYMYTYLQVSSNAPFVLFYRRIGTNLDCGRFGYNLLGALKAGSYGLVGVYAIYIDLQIQSVDG